MEWYLVFDMQPTWFWAWLNLFSLIILNILVMLFNNIFQALARINAMFPTVDETHIRELFKK